MPFGVGRTARARLAHQSEIGHDQRRQRECVVTGAPVAVAERVKLLDIAEPLAGLTLDPAAQPDLQGAVLGFERPRRKRLDTRQDRIHRRDFRRPLALWQRALWRPDCQDARLLNGSCHNGGRKPDRQRGAAPRSRVTPGSPRQHRAERRLHLQPAVMWLRKVNGSSICRIGSKLPPVPRTITVP